MAILKKGAVEEPLRGATLLACAVAVLAPRPTAGPALAFLQLFLRSPNAPRSGGLLLGILDPADELVSGQGRDVVPGLERRRVGQQRLTEVRGKLMHYPAGKTLAAHDYIVMSNRDVRPVLTGRASRT